MGSKEIIEGNKLIAEFMDVIPVYPNRFIFEKQPTSYYRNDAEHIEFKYDSDWNWLMPVVEKMELIQYEPKDGDDDYNWNTPYLRTIAFNMVRINRQQLFQEETKIKSLWKAVVEFIKWHNEKSELKKLTNGN